MDDSAITYDETIMSFEKETRTISTNFNENQEISVFYLHFY